MVRRTRPGISRFRVRRFASPRNDILGSGRAAHIRFAAADHAFRRGLGVGSGGGCAGTIFEVGYCPGFAPPNHDLEPIASIDRADATLSTASNECSAPLPA